MKVKDLIELLKTFDQELTICTENYDGEYHELSNKCCEVVGGDCFFDKEGNEATADRILVIQ